MKSIRTERRKNKGIDAILPFADEEIKIGAAVATRNIKHEIPLRINGKVIQSYYALINNYYIMQQLFLLTNFLMMRDLAVHFIRLSSQLLAEPENFMQN